MKIPVINLSMWVVRRWIFPVSIATCIFFVPGCDKLNVKLPFKNSEHTLEKAEETARAGDFKAAIPLYEESLDGTGATADVHYKLALIYEDKLKEPASALHHFRRYLAFVPEGSHAKDAKRLIKECEFRLSTELSSGASVTQEEAARLKNENLALRKQVNDLGAQLRAIPAPASAKGASPQDAKQKPIPPGARTYVVQQGDTLASIARKFYKNSARWKDIQDANFYALSGTPRIKPGQTLLIP